MTKGHVRKRGAKWVYVTELPRVDGRRKQRWSRGFDTRREAQRALTETLSALGAGTYVAPSRVNVTDFLVNQWLPAIRATVRSSTWASYREEIINHIVPNIGAIPLQSLTPSALNAMYGLLQASGRLDHKGGLSARTVRYQHTIVRRALHDAVRWGLVTRNVADLADPPRPPRPTMKCWDPAQIGQFLDHVVGHRLEALFVLALTSGMRRGELLGLRWSDVDFEGRRLSIRQTVIAVGYKIEVSEPKTDASRRSIVLDGATLADLGKHRARQSAERLAQDSLYVQNDLVFAALDGSPLHPQNVSAAFRRLCKSASLPVIRFHDLRHSYATAALSTDVHQKVVSERLGHSSIAITMDTYSHVMPSVAEEGALRIAAVIHGARTA